MLAQCNSGVCFHCFAMLRAVLGCSDVGVTTSTFPDIPLPQMVSNNVLITVLGGTYVEVWRMGRRCLILGFRFGQKRSSVFAISAFSHHGYVFWYHHVYVFEDENAWMTEYLQLTFRHNVHPGFTPLGTHIYFHGVMFGTGYIPWPHHLPPHVFVTVKAYNVIMMFYVHCAARCGFVLFL